MYFINPTDLPPDLRSTRIQREYNSSSDRKLVLGKFTQNLHMVSHAVCAWPRGLHLKIPIKVLALLCASSMSLKVCSMIRFSLALWWASIRGCADSATTRNSMQVGAWFLNDFLADFATSYLISFGFPIYFLLCWIAIRLQSTWFLQCKPRCLAMAYGKFHQEI